MSTEEKFNAAVNVIRNLPKNGSYQPSNELMLRFYAYFKQATQGPCTGKRPAFYDLVNRAKYDAWKKLGNLPKEESMKKYVDELHTIIETMSYSDNVANFLEASSNELESINVNDLELILGDIFEKVKSHPNSPFGNHQKFTSLNYRYLASRSASPIHSNLLSNNEYSDISTPSSPINESDHSDEEYTDTIEFPDGKKQEYANRAKMARGKSKIVNNVDMSSEISNLLQKLRNDVEKLTIKVNNIGKKTNTVVKNNVYRRIPLKLLIFLLTWPFVASFIMNRFVYRRK